jgi:hypothetical protein
MTGRRLMEAAPDHWGDGVELALQCADDGLLRQAGAEILRERMRHSMHASHVAVL